MKRLFIVGIAALIVILLVLGALFFFMQHEQSPEARQISQVNLVSGNGTVMKFNVEIADNDSEREIGLMNRTSMPDDAGMLFVWDNDASRYFWMDNTLIPLDLIFIDSDLKIINIYENATPMSRNVIPSSGACRYVLEVNGGLCAAEDVDVGDRITLVFD